MFAICLNDCLNNGIKCLSIKTCCQTCKSSSTPNLSYGRLRKQKIKKRILHLRCLALPFDVRARRIHELILQEITNKLATKVFSIKNIANADCRCQ